MQDSVPPATTASAAPRRIISAAVVTGRYRRVNPDIILRAYYAASLGHPDKEHLRITFGSTMARDSTNTGSHVTIDLPYGKTYTDAIKARGAIASGLRAAGQVKRALAR